MNASSFYFRLLPIFHRFTNIYANTLCIFRMLIVFCLFCIDPIKEHYDELYNWAPWSASISIQQRAQSGVVPSSRSWLSYNDIPQSKRGKDSCRVASAQSNKSSINMIWDLPSSKWRRRFAGRGAIIHSFIHSFIQLIKQTIKIEWIELRDVMLYIRWNGKGGMSEY